MLLLLERRKLVPWNLSSRSAMAPYPGFPLPWFPRKRTGNVMLRLPTLVPRSQGAVTGLSVTQSRKLGNVVNCALRGRRRHAIRAAGDG